MADIAPLAGMSQKKRDTRLISYIRRDRKKKMMDRVTGNRLQSGMLTAASAVGGGFLWSRFPQLQRVGAGNGRAGIDTRFAIGLPMLALGLMPRVPFWVQTIGETLTVPALWDWGGTLGQ